MFFGKEKKDDYSIILSSQLLERDWKRRRWEIARGTKQIWELTITRVSAKFQADDDNLSEWRMHVTKKKEGEEERLFLPTGDEFLIALTL